MENSHVYDDIKQALEAFANGEFVLVVDDEDRENEGDLIIAASKVTTQQMAFMIKHSSGYVCVPVTGERLEELSLPLMVQDNQDSFRTAYSVTCDYKFDTTTGISAHDRALTTRKLVDPTASAQDFIRPGHVIPLRARSGGLSVRRGHTEAAVDLCKLTGLPLGAAICELVKPDCLDGSMARRDDCIKFSKQHNIKIITIDQLVQAKREYEISNQNGNHL